MSYVPFLEIENYIGDFDGILILLSNFVMEQRKNSNTKEGLVVHIRKKSPMKVEW